MICAECSAAGTANLVAAYDSATLLHQQCKGDCPCLHKTGPEFVKHKGEREPLMRTQSP